MFGNQTLLCQMVLRVRSCAAAIRPDRARAWRARCRLGIQHLHHSAALHHRGTSTRTALAADPQVIAAACRPRGPSSVAFVFDYLKRGSRRLSSSPIRLWVRFASDARSRSSPASFRPRSTDYHRATAYRVSTPAPAILGVRCPKWPPSSRRRSQRSRGGHPSPQCLRRETSRRAAHRVAQSFPQASFGLGFGAVIHVTE
jgi:hypothetical protein